MGFLESAGSNDIENTAIKIVPSQVLYVCLSFRFPQSLKNTLTASYDLSRVCAINWGITHEDEAKRVYCSLGAAVEDTGKAFLNLHWLCTDQLFSGYVRRDVVNRVCYPCCNTLSL